MIAIPDGFITIDMKRIVRFMVYYRNILTKKNQHEAGFL